MILYYFIKLLYIIRSICIHIHVNVDGTLLYNKNATFDVPFVFITCIIVGISDVSLGWYIENVVSTYNLNLHINEYIWDVGMIQKNRPLIIQFKLNQP